MKHAWFAAAALTFGVMGCAKLQADYNRALRNAGIPGTPGPSASEESEEKPKAKGGKKGHGAAASGEGLVEKSRDSVSGKEGVVALLGYRGGPKETMVLENCPQCNGASWPPDVFEANGKSTAYRADDPPVKDPVKPEGKVPAVPVAVPTWCDGYEGQLRGVPRPTEYPSFSKDTLREPEDMLQALRHIALLGCDRLHYAPRQRQVANMLQKWSNLTQIKFEALVPVMAHYATQEVDRDVRPHGHRNEGGKSKDASVETLTRGCGFDLRGHFSVSYKAMTTLDILEGTGKLSEVDRAAAMCGQDMGELAIIDLKRLDFDKAVAEMESREPDEAVRNEAIEGLVRLQLYRPLRLKKLDAKVDEAYQAWQKDVGDPHKAELTVAFTAMARARGPLAEARGCSADTRPLLAKLVKAKAPPSRPAADALMADAVISVAFQADALCNLIDEPLLGAAEFSALKHVGANWLGGRQAALLALRGARTGDSRSALAMSIATEPVAPVNGKPEASFMSSHEVKAVKDAGDEVEITLVSDRWVEATYNCFTTDKPKRIRPDGYLEYEEDCRPTGNRALKKVYAPLRVAKEHAGLFAPKRIVVVQVEGREQDASDVAGAAEAVAKMKPVKSRPVIVYPDDKALKAGSPMLYYFGIQL
jgi:hypothetical protein